MAKIGSIEYEIDLVARMVMSITLNDKLTIGSNELSVELLLEEIEYFFGRKLTPLHILLLGERYTDAFYYDSTKNVLNINKTYAEVLDIW